MSYDSWQEPSPARRRLGAAAALGACLAALGLASYALVHQQGLVEREREARRAETASLRADVARLRRESAVLAGRLGSTERRLERRDAGIAPLAARVLRSVFTVHTDFGLGSSFAAWRADGSTYVITAYHVVAGLRGATVTISRIDGSWAAEVAAVDPGNDLALIRVDGRPAGAAPLWQKPLREPPHAGDELLLVGSPFGLEGTVTTGIVSRVTKAAIQTDAAANPGSSGGPAIDRQGRVVGVLVAGGGQNVNFAVPISRACAKLRRCS